MRQVNLIKNSANFVFLKKVTFLTKVIALVFIVLLSLTIVSGVVYLAALIQKVNSLSQSLPEKAQESITNEQVVKTMNASEKLKQIKAVLKDSPSYFEQYNYLFNLFLKDSGVEIAEFNLDNKNNASFQLTSVDFETLIKIINRVEQWQNNNKLNLLSFQNISLIKEKNPQGKERIRFRAMVSLKFKSGLQW